VIRHNSRRAALCRTFPSQGQEIDAQCALYLTHFVRTIFVRQKTSDADAMLTV
jgi:hypothetical protein